MTAGRAPRRLATLSSPTGLARAIDGRLASPDGGVPQGASPAPAWTADRRNAPKIVHELKQPRSPHLGAVGCNPFAGATLNAAPGYLEKAVAR